MADVRITQYPLKSIVSDNDIFLIADSNDIDVNGFPKYKKVRAKDLPSIVNTAESITYANLMASIAADNLIIGSFYKITDSTSGVSPLLVQAVGIDAIGHLAFDAANPLVTINYDVMTDTIRWSKNETAAPISLGSLSATTPLSYNNTTGVFTISQSNTSTNGYLSSADWNTFTAKQNAGNYITALTGEATASGPVGGGSTAITLDNTAVIGKVLSGLNVTGGNVVSTDSILTAFGKTQNQINALVGGVMFQGVWDAATNNPALTSSVGTKGYYYVVNVAGSTNLNGITDWKVGDWAIFDGTAWQKVDNTDSVSSVFGRVGAVVATEGDYSLTQLSDVTLSSPSNGQVLKYNGTAWVNGTDIDTGLTSVGLTMPSAFSVANSPLTANGTLAVTGAGVASQYVRGDGTLASFPTSTGGGSSISYYFNGGTNQGTIGGNTYYEMSTNAIIGTNADFNINADGYVAQFVTDANDPSLLSIPAGNWNFEMWFSASSGGGSPSFYLELYKYDGATLTLISSGSAVPEAITGGTAIDLYTTALAVPLTTLTLTDRLAVRVYVANSGRTITLHTQNGHLCQAITTFSTGLTALNGLTNQVQYLTTGTSGTDFGISSATSTHTFNLPTASATNRGALSSADWTTFNNKQNALTNPITGTGTTNYLPKFTGASALGDSNLINDSNGNLGLGVTPLNAYADSRAFEIGANGIIWTENATSIYNSLGVGLNFYYNSAGNALYKNTGLASSKYTQYQGEHQWSNAPSGTAGNAISFTQAMTLTNSGQLGIGTTSPSERLSVASTDEYLLSWQRTGDSKRWAFGADSSGTFISNRTDSVLPLFIKNSGNVLIGTITDAGYKLDVNGGTRIQGALNTTGFIGVGITPDYAIRAYTTNANAARISIEGTTNFVCNQFTNTGGSMYFGIDDSAGSNFTGTAYKRFLYSGGTSDFGIYTNGLERFLINGSTGAALFSSQLTAKRGLFQGSTGETLTAQGVTGEWVANLRGAASTGNSYGLVVAAGTNASDLSFAIYNQAVTSEYFKVRGDGAATFSSSVSGASFLAGTRTQVGDGYIADIAGTGNDIGIFFSPGGILPTNGAGSYTVKNLGSATYPWGAATFSSSVTATDAILSNIKPSINFTLSVNPAFSHSIVGENYSSGAAANNYMDFKVANAANTQQLALRLFGTGAAEFSSSVTAGGSYLINNTSVSKKGYKFQSPSSNWSPQESGIYFSPADGVNAATTFSVELWNGIGGYTNALSIAPLGAATFSSLAGIGDRMVISNASGTLSTQAIPSVGSGTTNYVSKWSDGTTLTDSNIISETYTVKTEFPDFGTRGFFINPDENVYGLGFTETGDWVGENIVGFGQKGYVFTMGHAWEGANIYIDSTYPNQIIKTRADGGTDKGLYLDLTNNISKFGVINVNGIKVGISNTQIGDYDFDDTGTILSVDRGYEIIKTSNQSADKGLYIDYPNNIYALGFTDGGNPFTDPVDGFVYTSDYTTIGSKWNWGEYIEIAHNVQRINLETNRLHYRNLTTTEINALTGNLKGDVVFNSTLNVLCFWNGTSWQKVTSTAM